MSTYQSLLSRVEMAMGEPHPAFPSLPQRFEVLRQNVQLLYNIALNTPVSWSVGTTTFTVSEGLDTYDLGASDFGKPILVETHDASDPLHEPRPIGHSSLQSLLLETSPVYPQAYLQNGTQHLAGAVAFYLESGSWRVRVHPMPRESATYRVWYELAEAADVESLQNTVTISHGESYLVNLCAMQLLPLARWAGMTDAQNAARRFEMRAVVAPLLAMHEREYRLHVATSFDSGKVVMAGFDDASYVDDGYY